MTPCERCDERGQAFKIRAPYFFDPEFDSADGLTALADGTFACPTCDTRYTRRVEEADMFFHDCDEFHFARVVPVKPKKQKPKKRKKGR